MNKSTKKIFMAVGILLILLLALLGIYKLYKAERNVVIEVNLTPEIRAEYEKRLADFTKKLATEKDPEDKLHRPYLDYFIEKARYEQYLGRLSQAEKTLKSSFEYYEVSSAVLNNLAKVYEQMGEIDDAIEVYEKLISDYQITQYYMDIARLERARGSYRGAFDAYWEYQKIVKQPDVEFETWLRENK
jgi:tetratricopeptide (TPR) repeat protein